MSKCWFHDWEIIERIGHGQIRENIENEEKYKNEKVMPPPMRIIQEDGNSYIKKVCMKCDTVIDTITPQIEIARKEIRRSEERKNRAKDVLEGVV